MSVNKTGFSKQALTPEKLLEKWMSQGLSVNHNDEAYVLSYLRYVAWLQA